MKNSIKWLATPILAAGIGLLMLAGCGKDATAKNEISIEEMNRAMGMMSMSAAGAPRTVDGLTNFPAFKGRPFPAPPAGKMFTIDPVSHQIVIVDK